MQVRLQYGLTMLLGFVTLVCFAFAYPRFTIGTVALLLGVLAMLLCFALLVYYPVTWAAERLSRYQRRGRSREDQAKRPVSEFDRFGDSDASA